MPLSLPIVAMLCCVCPVAHGFRLTKHARQGFPSLIPATGPLDLSEGSGEDSSLAQEESGDEHRDDDQEQEEEVDDEEQVEEVEDDPAALIEEEAEGEEVDNDQAALIEEKVTGEANGSVQYSESEDTDECPATKPTKYYKLPDKSKMVKGLPSGFRAIGTQMKSCDLYQLQKYCVSAINRYRAGKKFSDGRSRNHGSLAPVKLAPRLVLKCANEKALSDLKYDLSGKGCGHHTSGSKCGLSRGTGAENSCCARRCTSLTSCKSTLDGCFKQMWDEGKIVLDTGSTKWTMKTGHYWNMISKNAYVTCGFGFDSQGRMLAVQNLFN